MTRYHQRPEGAQMSSVPECDETEGNNDEQNSLFVDMPPKEKGCIPTKSDGTDEGFP